MVKTVRNIAILFWLCGVLLYAQNSGKIRTENKRLQSIKSEIESLQSKLKKKTKLEKESLNYLNDVEKKILLLNKYINELKREERKNNNEIKRLNRKIQEIEKKIARLKEMYSKYLVWYFKYGRKSKIQLLMDVNSLNDAVVRLKYLRLISNRSRILFDELTSDERELKSLRNTVARRLASQKKLLAQKKKEQRRLILSKKLKRQLLAKLRKDKNSIIYELENKRKAEKEIEKKIAELIRQENERLARLKAKNKSTTIDYSYADFENFNQLKGRLVWPVNSRKISRKFGKNINPKLKTVSLNYGIDIKARKNAKVRAVAGGIVSKIDWLPGYGSVIIITHKNNYRTVYGHVTDITVNEGDRVNAGVVLGKVDDSLEGYILHFEIWKARKFQNPSKWLARR